MSGDGFCRGGAVFSNWTGLTELFLVGLWWGRAVGASPLWCALGVTAVGAALVIVTILLGG